MIDYAYPEIWYSSTTHKTFLMTDGTVTVSGTSYSISDETITIDNSILDSESVDLKQAINPELQLYFGSSQSATLSFVIRYTGSTLKGKVLKVYIIPNHDASKILQIGVFKVDEDRKIDDEGKRNITAHDSLYDIINVDVYDWYNNDIFPSTESTCTVEELRNSFFEYFDITEEETELINDDLVLTATRKNEQISGALVLKWICELNGVFGVITNEGKLRYVELLDAIEGRAALDDPDVIDIPFESIVETSYEDYKSKALTGLSIVTSKGNGTTRWLSPGGDGIYVIAGNGLIDDYDHDAIGDFIITLSGKFGSRGYQPATVKAIGNPLIEVGDAIKVPLKNGGYIVTYVLERNLHGIQALRDTYNANGVEVWQQDLNSISYRAGSGGSGGGSGGGGSPLGIATFTNGRELTVGTIQSRIAQLTFGITEITTALVACTILAEISGVTDTALLTIRLRINRSWEEYFIPKQTVANGHYVVTINIPLSVAPLEASIIEIYAKMSEGSATIGIQNMWVSVTASGLQESGEWTGELVLEDEASDANITEIVGAVLTITEVVTPNVMTPAGKTLSDNASAATITEIAAAMVTVTDTVTITLENA